MSIVIESGILPPVDVGSRRGRAKKYPFEDMNVGDSFAVPEDVKAEAVAARARKQHKPKLFSAHQLNGAWRIWRTA